MLAGFLQHSSGFASLQQFYFFFWTLQFFKTFSHIFSHFNLTVSSLFEEAV